MKLSLNFVELWKDLTRLSEVPDIGVLLSYDTEYLAVESLACDPTVLGVREGQVSCMVRQAKRKSLTRLDGQVRLPEGGPSEVPWAPQHNAAFTDTAHCAFPQPQAYIQSI